MKKLLLSGVFALLAFAADAQIVNIPDPVFKNFLVNHSYNTNPTGIGTTVYLDGNHDGQIQYSEAAGYTSNIFNHGFQMMNLNITSLVGIEAFDSIEYLNVDGNPLTGIDISGCQSLKTLICNNNLFGVLNLNSASLEVLDCNNSNTLTSLDLGGCPALKKATIQTQTHLAHIDLVGCTNLEELRVNQNPALTDLVMGNHYALRLFQGYNNHLAAIDVSLCPVLQYLFCSGNPLTSLNLANGNPQSFIQIIASGFPGLTCIKVDNVAVSEFLWDGGYPYEFDAWANFSLDCTPAGPCVVGVPDAHFKAWLVGNAAINTNGNSEIECTEAEAYTGGITVDNADISDMTGIEAFVHITALSCNDNNDAGFMSLNVSGLTSLATVSCTGNDHLSDFNVHGCTALTSFDVDTGTNGGSALAVDAGGCTSLTSFEALSWESLSLDLNGCTALTSLDLDNDHLDFLDVRNCSSLGSLVCSNNALTALALNGCTALTALNCSNNNIVSLGLSPALPLANLDCSRNDLATLNVLDNPNLSVLNCSYNQLPYLFVSNNTGLTQLNCSNNHLSYLDLNNNPGLTHLDCSHNNLSSQNVNANTALLSFNCSHNHLSSQNIGSNTSLNSLYCDHNNLTGIDMSHNPALKILTCSNNDLTSLDLGHAPELWQLDCSSNALTGLDVSANPLLFQFTCTNNLFTALDVSETRCRMLNCGSNPQLGSLNFANGFNTTAIMLLAANNPALDCIQVDDAAYSTSHWTGEFFMFDAGVGFSADCALGTDATAPRAAFVVYPNPTRDVVHFSREVNVKLYNLTGQVIADQQHINSLDLSGQAQGVYFLTGIDDGGQVTDRVKIVKE